MSNIQYYQPWRNENSQRKFPFEDSATLSSLDGSFVLTDATFVDAAISCRGANLPIRIGSVSVVGYRATIVIVDRLGVELGQGHTDVGTTSDVVSLKTVDGNFLGSLTLGDNSNYDLFSRGDGVFTFGSGDSDFVASCVLNMPVDRGLLSFRNAFGAVGGRGDIHMVGEFGVQLEASQSSEVSQTGEIVPVLLIRAHAMGDPQYVHRACNDVTRRNSRPITELVFQYGSSTHVCKPDAQGNVIIVAATAAVSESALQTNPIETGLKINLPGRPL